MSSDELRSVHPERMSFRLRSLLITVALGPMLLYLAGNFFAGLAFRPEIYTEVILTSIGAAFMVAGIHAISTKQMPLRGGGTMTGQEAVKSGRACAVIGSLVMIGGAVALAISLAVR